MIVLISVFVFQISSVFCPVSFAEELLAEKTELMMPQWNPNAADPKKVVADRNSKAFLNEGVAHEVGDEIKREPSKIRPIVIDPDTGRPFNPKNFAVTSPSEATRVGRFLVTTDIKSTFTKSDAGIGVGFHVTTNLTLTAGDIGPIMTDPHKIKPGLDSTAYLLDTKNHTVNINHTFTPTNGQIKEIEFVSYYATGPNAKPVEYNSTIDKMIKVTENAKSDIPVFSTSRANILKRQALNKYVAEMNQAKVDVKKHIDPPYIVW